MPALPEIAAALEEGTLLFNRQEFYQAHEVWEEAWKEAQEDDDRHLLQGLIQVAAGFFKLQTGMPSGTAKLLAKAEQHLGAVPQDLYGLELAPLRAAAAEWRGRAERMIEEWRTDFDASALPRLTVRTV